MSVQLYIGRSTLPEIDEFNTITRDPVKLNEGIIAIGNAETNQEFNEILETPRKYSSIQNIYFHSSLNYLHEIVTIDQNITLPAATKVDNPYYSTFSSDKGIGIYRSTPKVISVPEVRTGDSIFLYHKNVRYINMRYTNGAVYPLLNLQADLEDQKWQKDNIAIRNARSYMEVKLVSARTGELAFLINEIHNQAYFSSATISLKIKVIGTRDA